MSRAAKSLFIFGLYLCVLGPCVLLFPNFLLRVFRAPPTSEVWIRLNGMFIICLAFFYLQSARHGLTLFIRWTIPARVAVIFYLTAFIIFLNAPKALLLFGLVDLLSAIWTYLALRSYAADQS